MSGFCPNHGPFKEDTCPYPPPHGDIGGRPEKPSPLDDEVSTDLGNSRHDSGEEPTEMPRNAGRNSFLDEDEAPTEYGRGKYDDLDVTELEAPSSVTLAMLWVKDGHRRGRTYPIKAGMIVGRKEGGLIIDDPKVSSMHAKFTMEGDNFVVWDFGSSNGTYVNGKKIREATVLEENDLVKIGDTVFVVKLLNPRAKRKVTRNITKPTKSAVKKSAAKKD